MLSLVLVGFVLGGICDTLAGPDNQFLVKTQYEVDEDNLEGSSSSKYNPLMGLFFRREEDEDIDDENDEDYEDGDKPSKEEEFIQKLEDYVNTSKVVGGIVPVKDVNCTDNIFSASNIISETTTQAYNVQDDAVIEKPKEKDRPKRIYRGSVKYGQAKETTIARKRLPQTTTVAPYINYRDDYEDNYQYNDYSDWLREHNRHKRQKRRQNQRSMERYYQDEGIYRNYQDWKKPTQYYMYRGNSREYNGDYEVYESHRPYYPTHRPRIKHHVEFDNYPPRYHYQNIEPEETKHHYDYKPNYSQNVRPQSGQHDKTRNGDSKDDDAHNSDNKTRPKTSQNRNRHRVRHHNYDRPPLAERPHKAHSHEDSSEEISTEEETLHDTHHHQQRPKGQRSRHNKHVYQERKIVKDGNSSEEKKKRVIRVKKSPKKGKSKKVHIHYEINKSRSSQNKVEDQIAESTDQKQYKQQHVIKRPQSKPVLHADIRRMMKRKPKIMFDNRKDVHIFL